MKKTIYETKDRKYRILEVEDNYIDMDNLKGDCYNPKVVTDIPLTQLKNEEKAFEKFVYENGVYGYVLEKWDAKPGQGYTHIDSCFGFIGEYSEKDDKFNHYIVDELKSQIPQKRKGSVCKK